MALVSHHGKLILRKMERNLVRLAADPSREAVHDFRTTSRRLETLLDLLLPVRDRNQRKLLKLLPKISPGMMFVLILLLALSAWLGLLTLCSMPPPGRLEWPW